MRSSPLLAALALIAAAALAGCDDDPSARAVAPPVAPAAPVREVKAFPWLPGLVATVVSTERSLEASELLAGRFAPDERCSTSDAQALVADVAPAVGDETVLASVATGLIVLDSDGRKLGVAPLADCGGSADAIVALAAGDASIGAPVVAVVFTSGGRREADTTLALYRVGRQRLEPLFSGSLETRDGDQLQTGVAVLLPGAIFVRSPGGTFSVHVLDRKSGRFEEP